MRKGGAVGIGTTIVASTMLGCSTTADPRPQLVVLVDTTAPVVGQLLANPELPLSGSIDTIRVDIVEGGDDEPQQFVAPDPRDWPFSFGIATADPPSSVLLRIRAFPGSAAALAGDGAFEPPVGATIDRVVELSPPARGVRTVRITLDMSCLGVRPDFVRRQTCVDEARPDVPATEGVDPIDDPDDVETAAGTHPGVQAVPCSPLGAAPGRICVAGGFTLLGDPLAVGLPGEAFVDPIPVRPAVLSPFYMDELEFTVGQYRELLGRGAISAVPDTDALCTWDTSGASDSLPVTCLSRDDALAACEAVGGTLPSEAQWEHAARGRGQGFRFAWGDEPASCCAASVARVPGLCGVGIEPVGSHTDPSACDGLADVSLDGIVDLVGSVSEYTSGDNPPYDDECWGSLGLKRDPECRDTGAPPVTRGGNWASGLAVAQVAARGWRVGDAATGFRCVYPGDG